MIHQKVDYHCHILPEIDDGARTLFDALAMAKLLSAYGFTSVHCTPHSIRGLYDITPDMVRTALVELQLELHKAEIKLQLLPGMEYYLDEYFPEALNDPLPLGESNLLLVEAPPNAHPLLVQENVFLAIRKGFRPLLAHPERIAYLAPRQTKKGLFGFFPSKRNLADSELTNQHMKSLRQQGCLFQGNMGSLVGYYGREVQRRAMLFQQSGLYDYYGSDGHRPDPLRWVLDRSKRAIKG